MQPELAKGAVVDDEAPLFVHNEDVIRFAGIDEPEFTSICDFERAEIDHRRQRYLDTRARSISLAGPPSSSTRVSPPAPRCGRHCDKPLAKAGEPVLAVPVAPTDSLHMMREEANDVVCLEDHATFGAIGYFYSDFRQVADKIFRRVALFFPGWFFSISRPAPRRKMPWRNYQGRQIILVIPSTAGGNYDLYGRCSPAI